MKTEYELYDSVDKAVRATLTLTSDRAVDAAKLEAFDADSGRDEDWPLWRQAFDQVRATSLIRQRTPTPSARADMAAAAAAAKAAQAAAAAQPPTAKT